MNPLSRKCKAGDCNDHTFSFRNQRSDTYYKQSVCLSLCPTTDRDGKVVAHSFPTFNTDGKCYTPAFALDMDKYTDEMDQQMLYDQQKKIKQAVQDKLQMLIPKPSHKSRYCSICKSNYDDYLDHIKSPPHKKCVSKSRYNKYTIELCSTLFKTQETIKQDKDETTKEKQEQVPKLTKKRRMEKKHQASHPAICQQPPYVMTYGSELLAFYNQVILPQMSMGGLSNAYGYMQYPYQVMDQQPMGYQMFIPNQNMFHQIPLLINNQAGKQ